MVFTIVTNSESFELNFFFAILPVCGMLSSRAWSDPIHVVRTFFSPETETAEKLRIAATNFYVSVSGRWTPVTRIGFREARWKFSTRPVETDWALTSCSWIHRRLRWLQGLGRAGCCCRGWVPGGPCQVLWVHTLASTCPVHLQQPAQPDPPWIRQWTGIVWHSSIVWAGAYLGDRRLGRTPQNGQGGENDVWNQAGKYIWVRLLDREVEDFLVWFNHFCKVHLSQMNYHSFVIPINSSQNVPVRIPSN